LVYSLIYDPGCGNVPGWHFNPVLLILVKYPSEFLTPGVDRVAKLARNKLLVCF
jgi:hypothetical protein